MILLVCCGDGYGGLRQWQVVRNSGDCEVYGNYEGVAAGSFGVWCLYSGVNLLPMLNWVIGSVMTFAIGSHGNVVPEF